MKGKESVRTLIFDKCLHNMSFTFALCAGFLSGLLEFSGVAFGFPGRCKCFTLQPSRAGVDFTKKAKYPSE